MPRTSRVFSELPPLSLYVHIPWCVRKCPYCDFNSHQAIDVNEPHYIDCLLDDLDRDLHWVQERPLHSIFIGGGTPSLFSAESITRLIKGIQQRIALEPSIEITLEANPGTAEQARFYGYREGGVNRLSIGVQSFNTDHLQRLGRIHNGDNAKAAIQLARDAGFENFNIDLMHGLPGQSLNHALDDLQTALQFQPPHLSWYQLTIEPNTVFYNAPPKLPEDDTLWDIQQAGIALLEQYGMNHYEVSAYAKAGRRSRHNLNYWQFGDYLGIGAGAHGKITVRDRGEILRYRKTRLPRDYMAGIDPAKASYLAATEAVPAPELPFEFFMNALRLREGVPTKLFEQRTGLDLREIAPTLEKALALGLLESSPSQLAPTPQGWLFLNDLTALFLEQEHKLG
ncbi:Oxygen-independent coproporphyrinogen III oxidase [gamma proteobacterium HdN1]|nr:Oxygen-independent coproporphyrinogen III oxidase [gamma proteobacterium HdN1]